MAEHDDLEKVARAIASVRMIGTAGRLHDPNVSENFRQRIYAEARAAIAAMGDGWQATHCFECNTELHGPSCPACDATALAALVAERDALAAEVARMREALKPFAQAISDREDEAHRAIQMGCLVPCDDDFRDDEYGLSCGALRRARAALAQGGEK